MIRMQNSDPLPTQPAPATTERLPRVLVWYEGNSDVFFRISERIADWLARDIPPQNIALALTDRAECLSRAREKGYVVFPYSGPRGHQKKIQVALSLPKNWLRIGRIFKQFRPDVVVITSNFGLAWPLLEQARIRGIRIVYLPHDPQPHSGDYLPLWQRFAQAKVVQRSNVLVFLSEAMRDLAKGLGGAFATVPSFVAPLHTLGSPTVKSARAPVRDRPIQFLFLGRMIRYKGLDLLFEACGLLANRQDWQLTLAGTGPETLHVLADFLGMSQVDLSHLRYLDEPEIDALMLSHDVLICPYRDATQSGVVAEAILAGLPSIVSPVGALPAQVDHGRAGWVMRDMSAAALADLMRNAIDDPDEVARMSSETLDFWARSTNVNIWSQAVRTALGRSEVAATSPEQTIRSGDDAPRP